MAYTISKSNGSTLILLNDGLVDTAATSINLIGKNVSNFGDAQNENFVHMLENFAAGVEPRSPLTGQIWYNSSEGVLRPAVFDGASWRPLAVSVYASSSTDISTNIGGAAWSASQPGDFWFDSVNKQLHVRTNPGQTVLIGPEAVTGFSSETKMASKKVKDSTLVDRPIIAMVVNDEVLGVISNESFMLSPTTPISGFTKVNRGITFKNYNSSTRYTTATSDVVLHGLHEQLDISYPRRNVEEHIQSNWYFDNGSSLFFGTTGQSSIKWANSNLELISTTGVRLQNPSASLTLDSTTLRPSTTVSLGESGFRFGNIFAQSVNLTNDLVASSATIPTVSSNAISATTIGGGTVSVNNVFAESISAASTLTSNSFISNNAVVSNLSASTIAGTTATITNINGNNLTSTNGSITTLNINTISGITITANTFNGVQFNGGTFNMTAGFLNGSPLVSEASSAALQLNAVRLKGEGPTGFQPASITNVGNTVVQRDSSGNIFGTSAVISALQATGGQPTSLGSITGDWGLTAGSRLRATYADLAENYLADANYEPGTVLEFGGSNEVTVAEDSTRKVAGVVSTNPAHLLNSELTGQHVVALALTGRVPCKVRGNVRKGDMMVSAGSGYARAEYSPILGSVIGKALEDFTGISGVIEVVVGRL
jgi:hypothetical protein